MSQKATNTTKTGDRYAVVANAATLMNEHLVLEEITKLSKPADKLSKLSAKYKECETSLISFLRFRVNDTKNVYDLAEFFRDACYAFYGMGTRCDLIKEHILGNGKPDIDKDFSKAVRAGLADTPREMFGNHPHIFDPLAHNRRDFIDSYDYSQIGSYELSALSATLLLKHLNTVGREQAIHNCCSAFGFSFMHRVTDSNWAERPLLGYYEKSQELNDFGELDCLGFVDFSNDYVPQINPSFVNIFADRLTTFVNETQRDSSDYFLIESIRQNLYSRLFEVYFGAVGSPLEVYHNIARLLDMENEVITDKTLEKLGISMWDVSSILTKRQSIADGITYELNISGLKSFLHAVEVLGLSGQSCVAEIADKLRKVA